MFFFFNDTATTEIYTLSLHDALPICPTDRARLPVCPVSASARRPGTRGRRGKRWQTSRSEEHTSELQSHLNLVCRLLLEKKKHYSKSLLRNPAYFHVSKIRSRFLENT